MFTLQYMVLIIVVYLLVERVALGGSSPVFLLHQAGAVLASAHVHLLPHLQFHGLTRTTTPYLVHDHQEDEVGVLYRLEQVVPVALGVRIQQ